MTAGGGTEDQTGPDPDRREHPRLRLERGLGQTEMARKLQLAGVEMTRETLVKIERGTQHITASQLRGIRDLLGTTYDMLLNETP